MQAPLGKGTSTKDIIIQILSEEWPLTVKQIYERVKKKTNQELTYQAVHKCVQGLSIEGALEKTGSSLQLNKKWLTDIKKFGEKTSEKYSVGYDGIPHGKPILQLKFNCFGDYGRGLVNDFSANFPNPDKKPSICCFFHTYTLVTGTEKEFENLRKTLSNEKHYSITVQNTFLDRYFNDFLEKLGKTCKSGVLFYPSEIFVKGDFIAQPFFPSDFWQRMNDLYNSVEKPRDFDFRRIMELYSMPYDIRMVIFEDKALADYIRSEVIKIFKSK